MPQLVLAEPDPDNPPDWCFQMNEAGQPSTCTFANGKWHRSWEDSPGMSSGSDVPGFFVVLFVLALVGGVALTVWKVSTARRMARDSGMSESDATAMTLLSDEGFESTYLASNLRTSTPTSPAPRRTLAERLTELEDLREQNLITQAEYEERRTAVLGDA